MTNWAKAKERKTKRSDEVMRERQSKGQWWSVKMEGRKAQRGVNQSDSGGQNDQPGA